METDLFPHSLPSSFPIILPLLSRAMRGEEGREKHESAFRASSSSSTQPKPNPTKPTTKFEYSTKSSSTLLPHSCSIRYPYFRLLLSPLSLIYPATPTLLFRPDVPPFHCEKPASPANCILPPIRFVYLLRCRQWNMNGVVFSSARRNEERRK